MKSVSKSQEPAVSPSTQPLPERLARKIELLGEIKDRANEFISLSDKDNPDHFSGLLFMAMTEVPGADQTSTERDVERAVMVKGTVADVQNMLGNVFDSQPGLFALIQEAVVLHVYNNYDPEKARQMLAKKEGE